MTKILKEVWYVELTTMNSKGEIKTHEHHFDNRLHALSYCIVFEKKNETLLGISIKNELGFDI